MGRGDRAIWVAAALLWAAPSFAQHRSEDALLNECYALRLRGRFDEALQRCQTAVRVSRTGRSLGQVALTEIALERWVDAATHLDEALADTSHPWVQAHRADLARNLVQVRPHVGAIEVVASEPDATVAVGSGEAVALPRATPLYVAPGAVELVGRSRSGEVRQTLTLAAGQATRVALTFPHAPAAVVTPAAVTPAAVVAPAAVATPAVVTPARVVLAPPREMSSAGTTRRTLAWATAGGAVAGFGFALVAWRLREGVVSDYNGRCPTGEVDDAVASQCAMQRAPADSERGTWETLTTVGLVAGAALAVGSVVLFVTAPSSQGAARTSMRCGAGPGAIGVQCGLSF